RLGVVDVRLQRTHPVDGELGHLPDPRRDERHAGGERLERALGPALLTRSDQRDVDRAVRLAEARAGTRPQVMRGDAEALQLPRDEPARRAGEQDEKLRDGLVRAREGAGEHLRRLYGLRLETVPPPDPVLDERADDEGVYGQAETATRLGPPLG